MTWNLVSNDDVFQSHIRISVDVFNKEECDLIIKYGENLEKNKAEVYTSDINKVDINFETRNSTISWVYPNEETQWIYRRCTDVINTINADIFKFDLHSIEDLQFTFYDSTQNGFYGKHIDSQNQYKKNMFRKLSFAIQLNDPSEYTGGDFIMHVNSNSTPVEKKLGIGYVFPSFVLHEVTPVTRGSRYSLVGWVSGPYWR